MEGLGLKACGFGSMSWQLQRVSGCVSDVAIKGQSSLAFNVLVKVIISHAQEQGVGTKGVKHSRID